MPFRLLFPLPKVPTEPPVELTCQLCGRIFSSKSHLARHTAAHVMVGTSTLIPSATCTTCHMLAFFFSEASTIFYFLAWFGSKNKVKINFYRLYSLHKELNVLKIGIRTTSNFFLIDITLNKLQKS